MFLFAIASDTALRSAKSRYIRKFLSLISSNKHCPAAVQLFYILFKLPPRQAIPNWRCATACIIIGSLRICLTRYDLHPSAGFFGLGLKINFLLIYP